MEPELGSMGWFRSYRHPIANWVSPRLEIRFAWSDQDLQLYLPNGVSFTTLEREKQRAEQEKQRADLAEQRAARLAEQLRALGVDPDQV